MILKKLTAFLTALIITASLAGCTQAEPEPTPTPEPTATPEPVVNDILFLQPGEGAWENAALNTALKAQGLRLNMQRYPVSQYADKLSLLTAGGIAFDLFSLTPEVGTVDEAAKSGLAAEISPPAGLKEKISALLWEHASAGGKVYGVPVRYNEANGFPYLIAYRTEPLAAAGYENFPSDGLTDAFSAIQQAMTPAGQEVSAFSWLGSGNALPLWLHRSYRSWPFNADNYMNLVKVDEEGNVSSYYESAQFKEDAMTYRRFYNAGLISGQAAAGLDSSALAAGNVLPSQGITDEGAGIPDLAFADLGEGAPYVTNLGDTFICASKTAKNQEDALKLVEWMYASQENYDLFHYGALDKDYTLNESGRMVPAAAPKADERLTGYRPYVRYGEAVSQNYIDAVTNTGEDAVIAKSALFRFDDSALQEQCRLLEAAVREYIYPIKFGLVSYDEGFAAAIEKLSVAGLRDYIAEYSRQYAAFLAGEAPAQEDTPLDAGSEPEADVAE